MAVLYFQLKFLSLGNGQGRARAETPTKREPIPTRKEFNTPTKRVSFNDDEVRARVSFLEQEEEEEEEKEEGSYMEEENRRIENNVEDKYEERATSQERSEDPNVSNKLKFCSYRVTHIK